MTTRLRTLAATAATLLALGAVPAVATPAAQAPHPAGPAGARLLTCRHAPSIDARSAVVGTWMRPLAGGSSFAVRIDLLQRATSRWVQRTDVPGLGTWIAPSDPLLGTHGGDVFKYRQAVGGLVVPSAYRFRVAFRWFDAAGALVRESATTTAVCRQPDLRPDLVLDAVRSDPLDGGLVRYTVVVRNAGRSASPRATVSATMPGEATPDLHQRSVGRLDPGASATVSFSGPGCAGGQAAAFVADPGNALDESRETNNERAASCPAQ